jgi:hypothetical protein
LYMFRGRCAVWRGLRLEKSMNMCTKRRRVALMRTTVRVLWWTTRFRSMGSWHLSLEWDGVRGCHECSEEFVQRTSDIVPIRKIQLFVRARSIFFAL